jgi:hypothetical protein
MNPVVWPAEDELSGPAGQECRRLEEGGASFEASGRHFLLLLHGWPGFARTSDLFLMDRLDLDSWEANKR